MSQPAAAFCIHTPTLETTVASHSTVKAGWRKADSVEPSAAGFALSLLAKARGAAIAALIGLDCRASPDERSATRPAESRRSNRDARKTGSPRASATAANTDDAEDGDEHEPGDDRHMLEERIELPDALDSVERPEPMRHHGRERREHAECAGAEPCPQVQDHQQRSAELDEDRECIEQPRRLKPKGGHLRRAAGEV